MECALGRSGVRANKREGDGATPVGIFRLLEVRYRSDRIPAVTTALPVSELTPTEGWCDDPKHRDYNRSVALPHPARCELLWRDDALYDLLAVSNYNYSPVTPGLGSAIFLHVAGDGFPATEGCIAFSVENLVGILADWTERDRVTVMETPSPAAVRI